MAEGKARELKTSNRERRQHVRPARENPIAERMDLELLAVPKAGGLCPELVSVLTRYAGGK